MPKEWLIQFYRVEPEDKIGVVTVQCSRISDRTTHVEVAYQYIPLSEKGCEFIDGFSVETYENFIGGWKDLLLQYFESAGKLSAP